MEENLDIVVYGAGAIGASIGGWLNSSYDKVSFLDQGEISKSLKEKGLKVYPKGENEDFDYKKIEVINDLSEKPTANLVIVAVKNYSLENAAKDIKNKLGDNPIIVALQNGIANHDILPKYFSKVIYGVICYNAWKDDESTVGFIPWHKDPETGRFERHGYIFIGIENEKNEDNVELKEKMADINRIFNLGFNSEITPRIQDAIRTKMVTNLGNCILALCGFKYKNHEISSMKYLSKITSSMLYEGVRVLKAAGYSEFPMEGVTSWNLLQMGALLPGFLSAKIFEKKTANVTLNSMAQDVLQYNRNKTELDSFNGYFIELGKKFGIKTPYNKAIYDLCRKEFGKPDFQPLDMDKIWNIVKDKI